MTQPRRFIVSTVFAWALTIAVGVMTVAGVVAAFLPTDMLDQSATRLTCVVAFAALAGLSLGNANCAAAAAQHTVSQGAPFWTATAPALLNAAIFCAASVVGVHLGWEILKVGAQPNIHLPDTATVDGMAFLVAFAKVSQAWVVETRRSLDAAQIEAAKVAEREELAAIRKTERSTMTPDQPANRPTRQPFQPEVVEGGRPDNQINHIGPPLVSRSVEPTAETAVVADRPINAAIFELTTIEPDSHSEQTWASAEAHAAALLNAGNSQRSVVRDTGLTRYKVGRIADRISGHAA
ncbi:MAG: hypothetical protein ABL889_05595 [Terricaulis sp.]